MVRVCTIGLAQFKRGAKAYNLAAFKRRHIYDLRLTIADAHTSLLAKRSICNHGHGSEDVRVNLRVMALQHQQQADLFKPAPSGNSHTILLELRSRMGHSRPSTVTAVDASRGSPKLFPVMVRLPPPMVGHSVGSPLGPMVQPSRPSIEGCRPAKLCVDGYHAPLRTELHGTHQKI